MNEKSDHRVTWSWDNAPRQPLIATIIIIPTIVITIISYGVDFSKLILYKTILLLLSFHMLFIFFYLFSPFYSTNGIKCYYGYITNRDVILFQWPIGNIPYIFKPVSL